VKLLLVGAGVIGTVYGAHFAAGGVTVSVLDHGQRTREVGRDGLVALDILDGQRVQSAATVVPTAGVDAYDVVLLAVRCDQLAAALNDLECLAGEPALLLFGNNPAGRSAISSTGSRAIHLGFPGLGGVLVDGVAQFVRIPQQPTALEVGSDPRIAAMEVVLRRRGFAVQRVPDMDGWLAYHAVFVSCVAAALYRCGTDPVRLAEDRRTLGLMCQAVTEGFAALHALGVGGLPRNLAVLHNRLLRWLAVRYWAQSMRSRMGELCFAARARHAEAEMRSLARDVIARVGGRPGTATLRLLLEQSA
jgi:2-dehydropantoate 2-reductase